MSVGAGTDVETATGVNAGTVDAGASEQETSDRAAMTINVVRIAKQDILGIISFMLAAIVQSLPTTSCFNQLTGASISPYESKKNLRVTIVLGFRQTLQSLPSN